MAGAKIGVCVCKAMAPISDTDTFETSQLEGLRTCVYQKASPGLLVLSRER
jgi:hypothetical protein